MKRNRHCWPIWENAAAAPPGWTGWPEGKRFALVLTHDVDSGLGASLSERVADLEEERGLRSAFAIVPLRYEAPDRLRQALARRGFSVMVHDLYHDGKLFRDRATFEKRRSPVNAFLKRWDTRGFASAAMLHNLFWISELEIDYDISTYDVDPFEPQACGIGRIFPYWVQAPHPGARGFIELPYTLPQDFTLFVLLRERSNAIWRRKLDWIASNNGLALIKTHPDYMVFPGREKRIDGYPVTMYSDFLDYVRERYADDCWFATPAEVARYWSGLGHSNDGDANVITPCRTFCSTCRQAHSTGWLRDYRPHQTLGQGEPARQKVAL